MLFRYKLKQFNHPIISLGGRFVRPRPIVTVSLVGPANTWPVRAILDTGADDTVFPEYMARKIGLDLSQAPAGVSAVANAGLVTLRYAQILLRLTDGREQREWPAWVGFTPAPVPLPMLGFAGCLQFFSAHFHGDREEVELAVNALYPGT